MSDTCFVCCDNFDLKNKSKVKCNNPSCQFLACKTCTRNYLLNTVNDVHCMNCKQSWDQTFVILNLNRNWFNDVYRNHRNELLFQSEQSKIPETMPDVEKYNKVLAIKKKKQETDKQILALQEKINACHAENFAHNREINIIQSGTAIATTTRQKFIMSCQKEDCQGFLSTSYKCGVCSDFCCPHCLDVLGPDKHIEHTCKKEAVETATLIKNTTKPCPNCGERINKIDGCDQMWCTTCRTAFSWKTGNVQNGIVHNPHYFQYMRNVNNGNIPRQPGDNPCADTVGTISWIVNCIHNKLYDGKIFHMRIDPSNSTRCRYGSQYRRIHTKDAETSEEKINEHEVFHNHSEIILSALREFRHIEHVEIPQLQNTIDDCNNLVSSRVEYIVKATTKDDFLETIKIKDVRRKKTIDLLFVYELIRTVGFDTVHSVLDVIDNDLHISRQEIQERINHMSLDKIKQIFENTVDKIQKFTSYCNTQFNILSVSHNTVAKHFHITTGDIYVSFRHLHIKNECKDLWGYMPLKKTSFGSTSKSTIKSVKEYYSKL